MENNRPMTRKPRWYSFAILLLSFGCNTRSGDGEKATVVQGTTTPPADSVTHRWGWSLNSEDVDSTGAPVGSESKFEVRAYQFQSGRLQVFLDTAPPAPSARGWRRFAGDSVTVTGLTEADRLTIGCNQGAGPYPKIGVLRDSVYERPGRPRFLWFLDTVNVRIRPLPIDDSALCALVGH
jgi:hypothetical protein